MNAQPVSPSPAIALAPSPRAASARISAAQRRRLLGAAVGAAALALAAALGVRAWRFAAVHEETDDAEVEGHVSPVLPRVSGYVARVLVDDNQRVAAGQPLVEIDPRDLDLGIASAEASLQGAQAAVLAAQADFADARAAAAVARAEAAVADVARDKTAADLARDGRLFAGGAITEQELRDSRAAADAAAAQATAAARRVDAAIAQITATDTRRQGAAAEVAARRAALAEARLQRSYATLTAPIAGLVSRKNVEPGEYVQAGQTLLAVTEDAAPWVVANFKETQLARMRPGEAATFTADSYPGVVFAGRVDSLAGATGARFALLPPDNASGNFIKVTQRVPVKIVLAGPADPAHPLRPGMSVDATVDLADGAGR